MEKEELVSRFQGVYEYAEKRSTFLFLCGIYQDRKEFHADIKLVQETFPKAAHILTVARIKDDTGLFEAASENGEPVKSAHKVLFALAHKGVGDVGLFAVRHYGGKKLGAKNLDGVFVDGFLKALESAGR